MIQFRPPLGNKRGIQLDSGSLEDTQQPTRNEKHHYLSLLMLLRYKAL